MIGLIPVVLSKDTPSRKALAVLPSEAAVGAIEAGADMILSTKNFAKSYNGILDAVKKGQLTEERIDQSLTRIYKVKFASKVAGY